MAMLLRRSVSPAYVLEAIAAPLLAQRLSPSAKPRAAIRLEPASTLQRTLPAAPQKRASRGPTRLRHIVMAKASALSLPWKRALRDAARTARAVPYVLTAQIAPPESIATLGNVPRSRDREEGARPRAPVTQTKHASQVRALARTAASPSATGRTRHVGQRPAMARGSAPTPTRGRPAAGSSQRARPASSILGGPAMVRGTVPHHRHFSASPLHAILSARAVSPHALAASSVLLMPTAQLACACRNSASVLPALPHRPVSLATRASQICVRTIAVCSSARLIPSAGVQEVVTLREPARLGAVPITSGAMALPSVMFVVPERRTALPIVFAIPQAPVPAVPFSRRGKRSTWMGPGGVTPPRVAGRSMRRARPSPTR